MSPRTPLPRRTHRLRLTTITAVIAVASVTVLAGCSSSGQSASSGPATMWALTESPDGSVTTAVKDWNAAHPGQKINVQFFANDAYKTKIRTAVGAGSAPTIIYSWAGGTLEDYVKAGKVADLTADTSALKAKINTSVFDLGVVDGKTYAVPMGSSAPAVLYFNKTVLADAGVSAPKTWDDLLDVVKALKAHGTLPIALAGGSKWPELMWEEYLVDRVAGPDAFKAIEEGKKDAWSNPGVIKANTMLQQLVDAGAFGSDFNSVVADSNADAALLYTGKAGMLLQGTWAYSTFQSSAADFTKSGLGYTSFPTVSGGAGNPKDIVGNVSGYFSVAADASAAQKEAAIAYLTKQNFNDDYTEQMIKQGAVPPVNGATDKITGGSSTFQGSTADLVESAPSFQMSWDQALPSAQATALLTNLDKLFSKQITPEQFSDAMNKTIGQ